VRIKELAGCMSYGSTAEEALRMIDDAMRGWLEVELEDGEPNNIHVARFFHPEEVF
jgi:antitoxin HicB